MDYAVDTISAMDGAPEHSQIEKNEVGSRIGVLRGLLAALEASYLETAPAADNVPVDPEYIAAVGHS